MAPYAPLGVVVPYRDAEERIASGHQYRQIVRRTRGLDNDPLRRIPVRRHVACMVCTLRVISSEAGFARRVLHGMNMILRRPILLSLPPHGGHPNRGAGLRNGKRSDRGDREHDARSSQRRAGGAPRPSSRAEGCGPGASSASAAQDDELADFLRRARDEIAPEAKRLLAQRVAE
jgi:hypothetical protein